MLGLAKPKPPNGFFWYARYIADQRQQGGHAFRSVKAAIYETATQWEKLSLEEKKEWKDKARDERDRFRTDPELRTMTATEFVGQACEFSTNGMVADSRFWSRHWPMNERDKHGEELAMLDEFDTSKRARDRENMKEHLTWAYGDKEDALLREPLMFISVQSSCPVEAKGYVPETLAFVQFSMHEGIVPYSHFCCALVHDLECDAARRGNARYGESSAGEEDGCQTRMGMQVAAKLVFQRVKQESTSVPIFFCLADEFEAVYDVLCDFKRRVSTKNANEANEGRLCIYQVATIEDLAHTFFDWKKIPLPAAMGDLQHQLYFDTLMERSDQKVLARLRCGAHESDSLRRCPLSVVRLAALKVKDWFDKGGIPNEDLPLIERQQMRMFDWPTYAEYGGGDEYPGDGDGDGATETNSEVVDGDKRNPGYNVPQGKHEMTLAWIKSQGQRRSGASASSARSQADGLATASALNEESYFVPENQVVGEQVAIASEVVDTHDEVQNGQMVADQRLVAVDQQFFDDSAHRTSRLLTAGVGTELEFQDKLPFNARGIGRGFHLVPAYVEEFRRLKSFLE